MEKEQAQIGEQATKKESRKVLFDGEALAEVETDREKRTKTSKKWTRRTNGTIGRTCELEDDAYGEFYPGFDAGFGGKFDDDDDDDDKDKEAGEEGVRRQERQERTHRSSKDKTKRKQRISSHAEAHEGEVFDKYDSAFGVVSEKKKNEDNEGNAKEKEAAGGKRAKRLKI